MDGTKLCKFIGFGAPPTLPAGVVLSTGRPGPAAPGPALQGIDDFAMKYLVDAGILAARPCAYREVC